MPGYDFRTSRLFVDAPLRAGVAVSLDRAQAHYLANVLRLKAGDAILVFNGHDGEWSATIEGAKRTVALRIGPSTRPQTTAADLHYLFAPLKSARLDYVVQKAVELGVSRLQPVITRHGQVARVNLKRMRGNTIEAVQQCGILSLPDIGNPIALPRLIAERNPARWLVFCDEDAEVANPAAALGVVIPGAPLAVLIGPEGGFAGDERALLLRQRNVVRLALGPRILRADTAAVAALALVQTILGDWR
jgi:16S rRNA (uracil1498-N3)-methyltransferase